jgi:hypothetical protein
VPLTLLAAHLALAASLDPLDRYEAWRRATPSLEAEATVSGDVACTLLYKLGPGCQEASYKFPGAEERLHQVGGDVSYWFLRTRTYVEYGGIPRLSGPPPEASTAAILLYPGFLLVGTLRPEATGEGWKADGQEEVAGVLCDVVRGEARPSERPGIVTEGRLELAAWIDRAGRLRRYSSTIVTGSAREVAVYDFTKFQASRWKSDEVPRPPDGYVPLHSPVPGDGAVLGRPVRLEGWLDAASKPFDAKRAFGRKGVVVLMTAPGCGPSRAGAALWRKIEDRAKREGLGFVELSLGPDPPEGAPFAGKRYWDKAGKTEQEVRPHGTPFLLRVKEDGTAVRQWFGYAEGEDAEILEAIF